MRFPAWIAALALASCGGKPQDRPQDRPQPKPEPGSAGSSEDVPAWVHDPPAVLRDKINGVNAHLIVLKSSSPMIEYRDVLKVVEDTKGVTTAEPFIFAELEIATAGKPPMYLALKAVDPARVERVLTVGRHMKTGTLASLAKGEPPPIVLGDELARALDVGIGDDVTLTQPASPHPLDPPNPGFKPTVFRVSGTFHVQFDEYDARLALVSLTAAQAMFGYGDQVMGIEATVDDLDRSDEIAKGIEVTLGGMPYHAQDWYELNKSLFTNLYGDRRP